MDAAGMQKLQPPLPSPKTPLPQTSSASLPPPFEFCHFIFFFLGFWCNTRILFSTRSIPPGLIVIHNLVSHDRFCPLFLLLYTHRPKHMRPIPLSFRIKAYNHMHESSCKVSMTTLKHLQQLNIPVIIGLFDTCFNQYTYFAIIFRFLLPAARYFKLRCIFLFLTVISSRSYEVFIKAETI